LDLKTLRLGFFHNPFLEGLPNAILTAKVALLSPSMLKASEEGSIVITLTPGLTIIIYSHKASEAGS
jgi:hypothetical protein